MAVYSSTITCNREDGQFRYFLRSSGTKPVFCIGINPSIANERIPDTTIESVISIIDDSKNKEAYNFDSWVMLNLYPQITSKPQQLQFDDVIKTENQKIIKEVILNKPTEVQYIFAAWGNILTYEEKIKNYLMTCIKDIYNMLEGKNTEWLFLKHIIDKPDELYPPHPRRTKFSPKLSKKLEIFPIEDYLAKYG